MVKKTGGCFFVNVHYYSCLFVKVPCNSIFVSVDEADNLRAPCFIIF